ncbi:MAG: hypothetical protein ACE5OY_08400 [Candidatus Bathyarchaeia archaeon]
MGEVIRKIAKTKRKGSTLLSERDFKAHMKTLSTTLWDRALSSLSDLDKEKIKTEIASLRNTLARISDEYDSSVDDENDSFMRQRTALKKSYNEERKALRAKYRENEKTLKERHASKLQSIRKASESRTNSAIETSYDGIRKALSQPLSDMQKTMWRMADAYKVPRTLADTMVDRIFQQYIRSLMEEYGVKKPKLGEVTPELEGT